jgi:hypothetical protein
MYIYRQSHTNTNGDEDRFVFSRSSLNYSNPYTRSQISTSLSMYLHSRSEWSTCHLNFDSDLDLSRCYCRPFHDRRDDHSRRGDLSYVQS